MREHVLKPCDKALLEVALSQRLGSTYFSANSKKGRSCECTKGMRPVSLLAQHGMCFHCKLALGLEHRHAEQTPDSAWRIALTCAKQS